MRIKIVVNDETLVDDNLPTMADEGIIAFPLYGSVNEEPLR